MKFFVNYEDGKLIETLEKKLILNKLITLQKIMQLDYIEIEELMAF